jgi:hypothetical protein
MATVNVAYSGASPTTITISPASLATSSAFIAGRESNQVDNTSTKYVDAHVQGLVTVGTTPTANTQINVYVWASQVSLATTPIDVLDGTDSAETLTNSGVLASGLRLARQGIVLATTSDVGYPIAQFSVCRALGLDTLPTFWGLYIAHNTGANLNATGGNHVFTFMGVTYTVA